MRVRTSRGVVQPIVRGFLPEKPTGALVLSRAVVPMRNYYQTI